MNVSQLSIVVDAKEAEAAVIGRVAHLKQKFAEGLDALIAHIGEKEVEKFGIQLHAVTKGGTDEQPSEG